MGLIEIAKLIHNILDFHFGVDFQKTTCAVEPDNPGVKFWADAHLYGKSS